MEFNLLFSIALLGFLFLVIGLLIFLHIRISNVLKCLEIERADVKGRFEHLSQTVFQNLQLNINSQKGSLDSFHKTLEELRKQSVGNLKDINEVLRNSVAQMNKDNTEKLEKIRATVDEKLQSTLEKRLGTSFKLVSERLEEVHKGIGEMQSLATGVGDLKKVLSNIKTRGIWGEVQIENILTQVLAPSQYSKNVKVNPKKANRVEYAIVLPSKGDDDKVVYIPVDSKFPLENYQILVSASETSDAIASKTAFENLIRAIKVQAKDIYEKYVEPPYTTDFALMFLPIEGLYAECLKEPGLIEHLQHNYKVIITSPTTFSAILNSLQMGFRTLAIEKRSSQVWDLLSKVKVEFAKFADILSRTKVKLDQAARIIDDAQSKTRNIERKLSKVDKEPIAVNTANSSDVNIDGSISSEVGSLPTVAGES